MKEKNMKPKSRFWKAGVSMALVLGVVSAMIILVNVSDVVPNQHVKTWHVVAEWTPSDPVYAEADPGAGAGGILEIYLVNHSATNLTENNTATVEGWCDANGLGYASADDTDVDIAHSTTFDIAVKVRANQTQAYRTDKFFDTDVRVRMTSADLSIGADTVLDHVILDNSSSNTFIWLMFETKGSGASGFTISKDSTNEITSIKFEAYY